MSGHEQDDERQAEHEAGEDPGAEREDEGPDGGAALAAEMPAELAGRLARWRALPPPAPPVELEGRLRATFRARMATEAAPGEAAADPPPSRLPAGREPRTVERGPRSPGEGDGGGRRPRRWPWAVGLVSVAAAAGLALWIGRLEEGRVGSGEIGEPAPTARSTAAPAEGAGAPAASLAGRADGRHGWQVIRFDPAAAERPAFRARVELTTRAAAHLGWPLAPDLPRGRVEAEVLYGEDGQARGFRFLPATYRTVALEEERP